MLRLVGLDCARSSCRRSTPHRTLNVRRRGSALYCVQVSARLLHFPRVCCSCGSGAPDQHFRASATRTTGKKVVKTDMRSWDFPICSGCLRWISQQRSANSMRGGFIALVIFAVLGVVVGVILIREPVGIFAILLGALLGAIAPFVYQSWQKKQAAADKIKPSAGCMIEPVVYNGWSGTVHTFYFSSGVFCEQFPLANANKLLG
jgi:hypothetical protein